MGRQRLTPEEYKKIRNSQSTQVTQTGNEKPWKALQVQRTDIVLPVVKQPDKTFVNVSPGTLINPIGRATQESARERYSIRQDEARKRTEAKEQKERLERLRTIEASMPEYQKPEWAQKIAQAEQALANTQQQQNEIFARKQEQRIADLNRVMANRDFLEYAEQGKATANPTWDQAARNLGELQNPVAFANQNADYLKRMQASTMGFEETGALTSRTADLVKYTYMTQAEQNTYNYYLAKEGKEKAQEYLDALDRRLDERRQAALNKENKQNAAENKVSGIVGNLVSSYFTPGAFLETIRQNVENANTGEYAPVNAYSPAMMGVHAQTATQEGVTGDIESPTLKFLADTGLSIGQNLVRYPMGPLGLGMMGLGAAGSTATEATLRGATADQALELGTIAGAAEVLTEKLPMDNFFRLLKTGSGSLKSAMLEALKQVGTEASEEMVSEYVNRIADTVIMGDLSEMNQYITELVSAGYSQEEAEKMARSEFYIKQPLLAGLGGAISGGVLGGGATLYGNTIGAAYTGRGLTESGQAVDLLGKTMSGRYGAENAEYARNLVQGSEDKNKVQNRRLGVLAYQAAAYEAQVTETADRLAKAFGRKVELFDKGAENGYIENGYFKDGTIYINRSSQNPIAQVFSHELTHSLEGTEGYNALQSYVLTRLQEQGVDLKQVQIQKAEQYRKAGRALPTEAVVNSELLAEYVEKHLLTNEKEVLRLARTNQSVAYRVLDWIETAIAKVTGNEEKQYLLEARALYRKALGESETVGENEYGSVRYAINPIFANELDAWDGKSDKTFQIGTTSNALQSIGVDDRPIIWHSGKINKILQKHAGMTLDVLKQVPNILENPIIVLQSQNTESRLAIFGEVWDRRGAPVTAILELQPTTHGGQIMDLNVIASVYGKNSNPKRFISESDVLYLDPNKNRTDTWLQGLGLQLPSDKATYGSIGNVSYTDGFVNIHGTPWKQLTGSEGVEGRGPQFSISEAADTAGNRLSADQDAYFKDSVVRDENGNLKPLWHGTDRRFHTFEKGDIGFHFGTYEQADARSRESGNQVMMECFLNLRNPLVLETDFGMWNANRIAEGLTKQGVLSNAEYRALQSIPGFAAEGYDSPGNAALRALLEAKGYDGIQYRNVFEGEENAYSYIVFHPNQVKFVNNLTPTQDPDMRFSISEAEEYERLLALARKWYGTTEKNAKIYENKSLEKVKQEYKAAVDNRIKDFVIRVRDAAKKDKNAPNKMSIFLGQTNKREQDDIKAITGVDITGYSRALPGNAVNHIEKRHGEKGNANQSMGDIDDLSRMQYVLDNYDYMEPLVNNDGKPSVSTAYINKDGTPAQQVRYVKRVNGDYYVVCVAQDTSKKRLVVISAYRSETIGTKKRTPVHGMLSWQNAQQLTPKASYQTTGILNNTIIPDVGNGVNNSVAESEGKNNAKSINNDTGGTGAQTIQELVAKYGAIPPGENPAREASVPQKTAAEQVVSRFARTLSESGVLPEQMLGEVETLILDGRMSHEVITDKKAEGYARNIIETQGWDDALTQWKAVANGTRPAGKYDIALGQTLFNQACQARDVKTAKQLAVELAVEATRAGQVVQAQRLLKKLTPDGQLYALEKTVQRINRETLERYKEYSEKHPQVEIDESAALRLLEAKTREDIDAAVEAIQQNIADQIPATGMEKWNAWRYLSMLGNVRTHVRNIIGNAIFVPAVELKNIIGAGMENIVVPRTERTKTILNPMKDGALLGVAKSDWEAMAPYVQSGGKYSETDGIQEKRRIFKNQIIEGLRQLNFKALEAEDAVFLRRAYINSFTQMAKARRYTPEFLQSGTTEAQQALSQLRNYATLEAQKATYRDANATAHALNKLKQSGLAGQLIGEGILPFTKTPANILRRGMEYSPVGLLQGIGKLAQVRKTGNASAAIDRLSAGMSGTMMLALGAFLAHLGLLSGGDDEDEREQAMDELTGGQSYALNLGDRSYTLDWASPMSMPLFVGVELYKQLEQGFDNLTFRSILDSLTGITEPVFEMSMLSGIQDSISAVKFSESPVTEAAAQAIASYFSQAVPTLFGQVARSTDDTRRRTYTDKNSPLPGLAQSFLQKGTSKIPGLNQTLQPYVDQWGRTEENAGVFGNMISPGFYSRRNETPVDKEVLRLYRETGNGGVVPGDADKYILYKGERKDLTAEEYTQYATEKGQLSYALVEEALGSWKYKRLSDADKAELIANLYGYSNAMAKTVVSEYLPEGQNAKAAEAYKRYQISPVDYFAIRMAVNDVTGDKNEEGNTIALSASKNKKTTIDKMTGGFSKRQKEYLYEVFGVSQTVW